MGRIPVVDFLLTYSDTKTIDFKLPTSQSCIKDRKTAHEKRTHCIIHSQRETLKALAINEEAFCRDLICHQANLISELSAFVFKNKLFFRPMQSKKNQIFVILA